MDYSALNTGYIYLYIVCEGKLTTTDAFFSINGKVEMKHKLDLFGVDVSRDRQKELVYNLMNLNFMLQMLCEHNGHAMPKEIKVIYDVDRKEYERKMQYENQLDEVECIDEKFDEWFGEMKSNCEGI
jgi:hypothetical protein